VRISGTNEEEVVSTDDEHWQARRPSKPASQYELDHCPEAQAAYQARRDATEQLKQVLPPTSRNVVLGRV